LILCKLIVQVALSLQGHISYYYWHRYDSIVFELI